MITLPQDDPSSSRAHELAQRRERYRWDHDYLAPFPFLHIPYVKETGVLAIYDILAGSFAALPEEERPSGDWLIRKTLGAGPAIYELLERVPRVHWLRLAMHARTIAREQGPQWIAHALRELLPDDGQRRLFRLRIPNAEQLVASMTELLLRSVDELGTSVLAEGTDSRLSDAFERLEDNVERVVVREQGRLSLPSPEQLADVLRGFVHDSVRGVIDSARRRGRELSGRAPQEEPGPLMSTPARGADPWLPEDIKRIIAPAELLVRFMAQMRHYHTVGLDGTTQLSNLVTELAVPQGPNPTQDDAEFGRRTVAGTNPVVLRRVHEAADLPQSFGVLDGHLQAALATHGMSEADACNTSLARAATQGRLYWTDYSILADVPCQDGPDLDFFGQSLPSGTARQRFLPAPYGLFYRWGEGERSGLWPIAIQLGTDPQRDEVFTPADDIDLWQRVKAMYLAADFNHHELATHLAGVHFSLEGFAVATARQLHVDHPVSALLSVHTRLLLWNNFLGRQTLTNPRGFTEQLLSGELTEGSIEIMRRAHQKTDFWDMHFPRELKRRGVDDREALPSYPFRDDGMLLWNALYGFVTQYIEHYYPSSRHIEDDHELAAWVAELRADDGAHVSGFPNAITSTSELVDVLTSIIFRSSVFHSGVNYGQFDLQGDPGHVPSAIYADPRRVRDVQMADILPGGETTLTQAGVMYVLADLRGDCLAEYNLDWFSDPAVWPMVARLRQELAQVEQRIKLANTTTRADRPYEYLRPSLVTTTANV